MVRMSGIVWKIVGILRWGSSSNPKVLILNKVLGSLLPKKVYLPKSKASVQCIQFSLVGWLALDSEQAHGKNALPLALALALSWALDCGLALGERSEAKDTPQSKAQAKAKSKA